jgi:predicted nucleic acid-binding protein
MAAFGGELVDPLIADMHGEEVAITERNVIDKMTGMASQMTHYLMNRSYLPSAMPDDAPVPTPVKRKIGETPGPQDQGYGPTRRQFVNAIGLDGETVKYVFGSMASASSSAGAAAGGFLYQRAPVLKLENGVHNVRVLSGAAVSGAGTVFNFAAGTARTAASGTGAILNYTGNKMMANMTQEDYHEIEAETMRAIRAQQTSAAVSQMHENAYQVQENHRRAEEAERKRTTEEAVAKAQQQELDFQDARSVASYTVRAKQGVGRRGNVTRSLNQVINQKPPVHKRQEGNHVRNEEAVEGFGRKLARGVSSLLGM